MSSSKQTSNISTSNSVEMKVDSSIKSMEDIPFEDEDIMVAHSSNEEDARFDEIIGHIEDIIMDPNFQNIQNQFMEKSYKHFVDTDENKLIYTDIHREYINLVEKYIENELIRRVKNFSMSEFMNNLLARREELDGEIFEILLTFEDFMEFKQLMLSYKASKEGRTIDLTGGLSIQSVNFETFRSSCVDMQTEESIHIFPHNQAASTTITSTTNPLTITSANNNNNNTKSKKSSSTPLLDNAQIDSDHEQSVQLKSSTTTTTTNNNVKTATPSSSTTKKANNKK